MSDLHEPDLNRAFDSLTTELATRPGRPGAPAAIAAARQRRRRKIGAAALVAAVTVAGFTLPELVGDGSLLGDDGVGFAGNDGLPAAAPLSAEALTEATEGWTGPWEALDSKNVGRLTGFPTPCTYEPGSEMRVEPSRMGDQLFLSEGSAITSVTFLDMETTPVAMELHGGLRIAMSRCLSGVEETAHGDAVLVHGSTSRDAAAVPAGDDEEMWAAQLGDRLGIVWVMRSGSAAPEETTDAVGELLLAAMRDETSYETSWSAVDHMSWSEVASDDGAVVPDYPRLTLARLRELTGDWSDGWRTDSDPSTTALHCIPMSWPSSSPWGSSSMVGDRGELAYAGTEDAAADISALLSGLSRCQSTRWTVHPGAGARGTAAWAAYDGGAVFIAERDGVVASLQVRDVPPVTDETAASVIGFLEQSLAQGG